MILLYRAPLLLGMLLLQVTPTASTPPTSFTDLLLQALPQVPIYVILAYIVINMQRDNAKESERRDKHEEKITDALVTQIKRVDLIEEDRREQWQVQRQDDTQRDNRYIESFQAIGDGMNRIADVVTLLQKDGVTRDRITEDAVSAITAIVTVGSKPLQQVVKDVNALQQPTADIHRMVSAIYDRFLKVFPADETMIEQVRNVLIEAVNKACEEKKGDTGPLPPITMEHNVHIVNDPPPDPGSADTGSEAA